MNGGLLGAGLDYMVPDWLYRFPGQEPGVLTGPLAQAAGITGVGQGFLGTLGTYAGARGRRYVTTVQAIEPTGQVVTVDVFKGKPLLTRQDMATVRKVKKTKGRLNRWFPTLARRKTSRRK